MLQSVKTVGFVLTARPTKLMIDTEQLIQKKYPEATLTSGLVRSINEIGFSKTAQELHLDDSTLNYWLIKRGITIQRVVVGPGDSIEIHHEERGSVSF